MMITNTWQQTTEDELDFESLFQTHYAGVYRLLFRIVGSQEEAEDLAQEAFIRLYEHRFPPGREHNLRAWLYRVATNLAYNALRSHRRRIQRQTREARRAEPLRSKATDPVEAVLRDEERDLVHRALARLSPHQAKLLLLYYAGLSYRELAEAVQTAPSSVGTLLSRSKASFESAYQQVIETPARGGHHEM
ncbi:MAG: sigma-70 family RNA polymerase sigma factor [Chloroflexia bacterium]|nr:sigma-70 family RNA polymerase sigma factor [Chloroflexia bacterium]